MAHLPQTEAEAETIIRDCAASRTTLEIGGGFTRKGFGNRIRTRAELSSSALTGITYYQPSEMVMSAAAGTPVAEIEAALDAAGQMLAFEPIDHRGVMNSRGTPTIGGVFATNSSGPRRFVAGAARDSLLGLRFINGSGELIRAGGRVMKNVTGLDLVKLLAGSFGTLGFITEVSFKVLPKPQATATLVISGLGDAEAAVAMAAAMALPVEVSGAAHLPQTVRHAFIGGQLPGGEATVLRLEGQAASVKERLASLAAAMQAFGPVSSLDAGQSLVLWREIRDVVPYADGSVRPLWKLSVPPSAGHRIVAALRLHEGVDAYYDWQGGLVWLRMENDPSAAILRRMIKSSGGGHATLLRAHPTIRDLVESFEPVSEAEAQITRRLREKFDPAGIFNPGKMG